jgi:hypothetical protein
MRPWDIASAQEKKRRESKNKHEYLSHNSATKY